MDIDYKSIGARVKDKRIERRLTRRDVAAISKTDIDYITRIENGDTTPIPNIILRINDTLQILTPEEEEDLSITRTIDENRSYPNFGKNLRLLRKYKGLTQLELSILAGCDRHQIVKFEQGDINIFKYKELVNTVDALIGHSTNNFDEMMNDVKKSAETVQIKMFLTSEIFNMDTEEVKKLKDILTVMR